MKHEWIKAMVGKLAATGTILLFLVLVPAAAAGSVPLWAAVLLGLGGVLLLNGVCGMLLTAEQPEKQPRPVAPVHSVTLRVVRGGRAA